LWITSTNVIARLHEHDMQVLWLLCSLKVTWYRCRFFARGCIELRVFHNCNYNTFFVDPRISFLQRHYTNHRLHRDTHK